MRLPFVSIGLTFASMSGFGMATVPQDRPNILWIVADDLGTDPACYGNKSVKTPFIDKLASEGVLFTQLHSVTAVCSPSRSSLITGMYPVSINCNQHRTLKKKTLPERVLPITEYFRQAGYYVCNGDAVKNSQPGKTDYNFRYDPETIFDGPDWTGRKEGQPFFGQMQIHFPHRPFEADLIHPVKRESIEIPPVYPDCPITRADWQLYLESVQHVDELVGKLMQRLEKEGLLDNTIVMFFGDQGRPMVRAKQFLYDEGTHTPFIIRFPDKKMAGQKVTDLISNVDIPATSISLAGISLPPKMQGQNIFSAKKRDFVFCSRDRMDETVDRARSVRSANFKYIKVFYPDLPYTQSNVYKLTMYPVWTLMKVMYKNNQLTPAQAVFMQPTRQEEELYDLKKDPFEINNVAKDPKYANELVRLREVMDKWLAENDKGVYPEDPEEHAYWAKDSEKSFEQKMKAYHLPIDVSEEDFLKWWEKRLKVSQPVHQGTKK